MPPVRVGAPIRAGRSFDPENFACQARTISWASGIPDETHPPTAGGNTESASTGWKYWNDGSTIQAFRSLLIADSQFQAHRKRKTQAPLGVERICSIVHHTKLYGDSKVSQLGFVAARPPVLTQDRLLFGKSGLGSHPSDQDRAPDRGPR